MTDLVKRLRDADISGHGNYSALAREAADRIEELEKIREGLSARCDQLANHRTSLQVENKRLRKALEGK